MHLQGPFHRFSPFHHDFTLIMEQNVKAANRKHGERDSGLNKERAFLSYLLLADLCKAHLRRALEIHLIGTSWASKSENEGQWCAVHTINSNSRKDSSSLARLSRNDQGKETNKPECGQCKQKKVRASREQRQFPKSLSAKNSRTLFVKKEPMSEPNSILESWL